jgi:hypothetical protein
LDFNSREFKALKAKWYGKLHKSGFDDIEHDEEHLKRNASEPFTSKTRGRRYRDKQVYFESREEYYRLAGRFLNEHKFSDKKEELIWSLHSEGMSIREIAKTLRSKHYRAHKRLVHETIQALVVEMGRRAR